MGYERVTLELADGTVIERAQGDYGGLYTSDGSNVRLDVRPNGVLVVTQYGDVQEAFAAGTWIHARRDFIVDD